jgi:hypothetical protein
MAVGLWVTQVVPNPLISLPLALGSHYVLDLIPHNDYIYFHLGNGFKRLHESPLSWVMLGMGFGFSTYLAFHAGNPLTALIGASLGILPDVTMALTKRIWFLDNPFVRLFNWFHNEFAHIRFDLGEYLYNLRVKPSLQVKFPEDSRERRRNYDQMKKSLWSFLGWFMEIAIEIAIILSVSFRVLR